VARWVRSGPNCRFFLSLGTRAPKIEGGVSAGTTSPAAQYRCRTRRNPLKKARTLALLVACAALAGLSARAADTVEVPNFNKRGDNEKAFVAKVGTAIVNAARKAKKIELEKYEFVDVKKGRTDLKIKMSYHGVISNKLYNSDIVVQIDSSDKEKWEVLNIKYKDDTKSALNPNEKNIQALIPKFNGKK
jgi:hypothetical protein